MRLHKEGESVSDQFTPSARTPGLKVFDTLLYPIITNFGVFGISVAATYLTSKGGERNASGKLIYGPVGQWFQKRGDKLVSFFRKTGMSESQADMSKMVFFSFLDGSLLAPVVKKFEDNREPIGKWIDDKLGTTPPDDAPYQAEPKQTWGSVLGGRFATCSIVVPTAYALDKTGLNDVLFTNPGKKVGETLSRKPAVTKFLGKLDVKELSKIGFFEFFYTSVCTAGLYFSSRFLCGLNDHKKLHEAAHNEPTAENSALEPESQPPKSYRQAVESERRNTSITITPKAAIQPRSHSGPSKADNSFAFGC